MKRFNPLLTSQVASVAGWTYATTVAGLCVYAFHSKYESMWTTLSINWSTQVSALYEATHRPAWAAAIGWVVIICSTGRGGKTVPEHIPKSALLFETCQRLFCLRQLDIVFWLSLYCLRLVKHGYFAHWIMFIDLNFIIYVIIWVNVHLFST